MADRAANNLMADYDIPKLVACKWVIAILFSLAERPRRFSELKRLMNLNSKVLSEKLSLMRKHGLIERENYYTITIDGKQIVEIFNPLLIRGIPPQIISDVLKCKWMTQILKSLYKENLLAGELASKLHAIRWKVLSERMKKLVQYGLVERIVLDTRPIRVRYSLTARGRAIARWIMINEYILPKNNSHTHITILGE